MRIGWTPPPSLRALLQTLGTLLACGLGLLVLHRLGVQVCLLKKMTGYPCPACGTMRATVALLRGDVSGALHLQPLMVSLMLLAVPVGGGYAVSAVLFRRVPRVHLTRAETRVAVVVAVLLLILNWIWLIRHDVCPPLSRADAARVERETRGVGIGGDVAPAFVGEQPLGREAADEC